MDIQELRSQINEIDDQLRGLFLRRMETARQIGNYKRANGLPVMDAARERDILTRVGAGLEPPLDGFTRRLYRTLFDLSRTYQSMQEKPESPLAGQIRAALDSSPRKLPATVTAACQGVEGAYSQLACDKLFAHANILYMDSFEGVARAVSGGLCDYGVLPIENNIYGSVNAVYDLMCRYQFYIVRSMKLRVSHCLAVKPGVNDEDVREIASHEQAIGQCSGFLKARPQAKVTRCANTAMAAKMVSESRSSDVAAICSEESAALYGLKILHRDIQDSDNNYTRFICIARDMQIFQGADRVSVTFRVAHKPGSLYEVLAGLAAAGLNLSKLESRPIPGRDFEFQFYADIECDCRDEGTVPLLCALEEATEQFVFLGAYSEA